jgi:hypothetical protein
MISVSVSTVILVVFTATTLSIWPVTGADRFQYAHRAPAAAHKSLKSASKFLNNSHCQFSEEKAALTCQRLKEPRVSTVAIKGVRCFFEGESWLSIALKKRSEYLPRVSFR